VLGTLYSIIGSQAYSNTSFKLGMSIIKKPLYNTQSGFFYYYSKVRYYLTFRTDSGKLIEHIYGFLMLVERVLEKYAEKNSEKKSE